MTKVPGKMLIKISSIVLAILGLVGLAGTLGVTLFSGSMNVANPGLLHTIEAYIFPILCIVAGVLGFFWCNNPSKGKLVMIVGVILVIAAIIFTVMGIMQQGFSVSMILFDVLDIVVAGIYTLGGKKNADAK